MTNKYRVIYGFGNAVKHHFVADKELDSYNDAMNYSKEVCEHFRDVISWADIEPFVDAWHGGYCLMATFPDGRTTRIGRTEVIDSADAKYYL